jgi:N-methylhydantoinase A/oxoprolinase/acetone carboxylase beta subunit
MADLRLAVVAGDTNVDAVVLDARDQLVARAKVPTSRDDERPGIDAAVRAVVEHRDVDPLGVHDVMVGLTETLYGALAPDRATRVAVIRIGGPLTSAVPPLATWPEDIRRAVSVGEVIVGGGVEYDGSVAVPLDAEATARFLERVAAGVEAVAIAGVFSTASPAQELAAAEIVRRELGTGVHVSLSHEIGTPGLLERENATVLNAALVATVEGLATAMHATLAALAIDAEIYFAANDGTLMALEHALRFPVRMIGGAVASSMCGAGFLSGVGESVVIDVGGSATDLGVLANGFPRESSQPTLFAGIRTSIRMPRVRRLHFGGGSVLHLAGSNPLIGPASVASDLARHALVFGGSTPTLTDAAVAGGRATIGTHGLDTRQEFSLRPALEVVDEALLRAVDDAETGRPDTPLIVVGGAGFLVPERLFGVSEVIRPIDADIASAIGAATAQVSGQAERICANRTEARRTAHAEARAAAFARATAAGADPAGLALVDVEEVPFAHVIAPAVRIRVKVLGPRA